jgi:UDP-N-acetylmuramate dehydrogenase
VTVREQVTLAGYTTLGLGGPAARLIDAVTDDEALAAVSAADAAGEPVLVLGGGSNLVIADEGFAGTVVRMRTRGIELAADGDTVRVTAAAGENWDALVQHSISGGLAGIECLSGIPGLVGATPIQNVGAYGQEVAQTIAAVRVYDRVRREITELSAPECGFGYRDSSFKRAAAGAATGPFVVLGVTFRLSPDQLSAPVRYGELARSLGAAAGSRFPLAEVRAAVLQLRRGKGMVLDPEDPDTRSAGSFFTNPVLSQSQLADLEIAAGDVCAAGMQVPRYPAGPGQVKVSAAWLIENAGFGKGYAGRGSQLAGDAAGDAAGGPRISAKHTLALVNPGGGSTKALLDLAAEITSGVRETFGVELVPEPVIIGG